jgi:hypothetical protein
MKNGYAEDYAIVSKKYKKEQQLKFELINMLQPKSIKPKYNDVDQNAEEENDDDEEECIDYISLLKSNKYKVDEIISDLGNSKSISVTTFKALCLMYYINVALIKNNICELHKNSDSSSFFKVNLSDFSLYVDPESETELERKYYLVMNIDKPFKSVSAYKVDDLKQICKQFNPKFSEYNESNIGKNGKPKKKTKKELYEELHSYL